jgi:stage II sporulation protein D
LRTLPARSRTAAVALAVVVAGGLAAVVPASPASAVDVVGRPPDGQLVLDGRGFGHGRGMSQYGAYGAALQGLSHAQILGFYYTGVELGTAPGAERRVLITADDSDATVTRVPGLVVVSDGVTRDVGSNTALSRVRARAAGGLVHIEGLQGSTWVGVAPATAGPVRLQVNGGVLDLHLPSGVRQYRGHITATLSGQAAKPLYVVNTVSIDDYVRGVVAAEMPSGWHEQALRAQAVAARSYGMQPCPQPSSYPATGLYDVVDTISCQVYGGLSSETTRTNDAVTATAGQVIRYGGAIVRAEFSASSGGWTVANGGPFVAKQDPYDAVGASAARSDVHRWTGARVPLSRLESAHGTGLIREVRVLQRNGNGEWGGRVLRVRLVGDTRTVEITGEQFRSSSGLRSSWFDLVSPIDAKWVSLGGAGGLLGSPVGPEAALSGGGRFRAYERGNIYWTLEHGAFETHGAILQHYGVHRWEGGILGYPVTDELRTPDGVGRYNHFEGGSIYWTSAIGPREVHGSIREAWARNRWEAGPLGYPVTDETAATPDRRGATTTSSAGRCTGHLRRRLRRCTDRSGRSWAAAPLGGSARWATPARTSCPPRTASAATTHFEPGRSTGARHRRLGGARPDPRHLAALGLGAQRHRLPDDGPADDSRRRRPLQPLPAGLGVLVPGHRGARGARSDPRPLGVAWAGRPAGSATRHRRVRRARRAPQRLPGRLDRLGRGDADDDGDLTGIALLGGASRRVVVDDGRPRTIAPAAHVFRRRLKDRRSLRRRSPQPPSAGERMPPPRPARACGRPSCRCWRRRRRRAGRAARGTGVGRPVRPQVGGGRRGRAPLLAGPR